MSLVALILLARCGFQRCMKSLRELSLIGEDGFTVVDGAFQVGPLEFPGKLIPRMVEKVNACPKDVADCERGIRLPVELTHELLNGRLLARRRLVSDAACHLLGNGEGRGASRHFVPPQIRRASLVLGSGRLRLTYLFR